jgi:maleylacetoacetate isomerase
MAATELPRLVLHHYWRSSCSWRVRWALALKGVPYEAVAVNLLKGEQLTPAFRRISPAGAVPCLVADGKPMTESLAILEWLEEVWPTPALLPRLPAARHRARQLALTVVAGTQPLQNLSVLKRSYEQDEAAKKAHAQFYIAQGLGVYETILVQEKEMAFSLGAEVTIADLCLVPQVYNAKRFDVDLGKTPRCAAIYARCLETPACQASAPESQADAVK